MTDKTPWSYGHYKRTHWIDEDGRRLYYGHFIKDPCVPGEGHETCKIGFWARRPVLAMRAIIASGKDPIEFNGQDIN